MGRPPVTNVAFTSLKPLRPNPLVYLLFLVSGVAGLISEISWSRQIGLVIGNTAPAVSLVLASYFVGMAMGQILGSRLAPRVHPLLAYGVAEVLAAVWSFFIPTLLAAEPGWGHGLTLEARNAARSAWCLFILLPATIPLGATFPLITEYFSPSGRRVAAAYALNTLGGVIGALAATSFLIVVVGVRGSGLLAAGLCAACGLLALGLSMPLVPCSIATAETALPRARLARGWCVLAGISGFATLGLEVLYTRMFALVLHNSTYTFGAVLVVFLTGLALGAGIVSAIGRRVPPERLAFAACGLGSIAVAMSIVLFVRQTRLDYFTVGESFAGYLGGVFRLVGLIVLPPATLLGMALPAAFAEAIGGGRAAGPLVSVNTICGAAGALSASFFFLPSLGLWGSFGLLIAACGVPALAILLKRNRHWAAVGLGTALTIAVISANSAPRREGDTSPDRNEELVRRWESAHGWIDVVRTRSDGTLQVRENLHYRHGSTGLDSVREYRQGRLPLLLHPHPTDVAFLGLGTGLTAATVISDRTVERAVVVELIPEVVEAARLLENANFGVVDHSKVEVRVDDARHFLLRTDRRFDLIVSDLFVPWESRAGCLFTVEHYAAIRQRLRPGGLFCQSVALYQVGPAEFDLIANTFAKVFPQTTLWWGQFDEQRAMVAIVGSDAPIRLDESRLNMRWVEMGITPGGPDPDLRTPGELPGLFLGRWAARPSERLNTDEHPWLEFMAPVSHRSRRTLRGAELRRHFDDVLAHLPEAGVAFGAEFEATLGQRFATQRGKLFAEPRR